MSEPTPCEKPRQHELSPSAPAKNKISLLDLPAEILQVILLQVGPVGFLSFRRTCQTGKELYSILVPRFFSRFLSKTFNVLPQIQDGQSYDEYYDIIRPIQLDNHFLPLRSTLTDCINFVQKTQPPMTQARVMRFYLLLVRKDDPVGLTVFLESILADVLVQPSVYTHFQALEDGFRNLRSKKMFEAIAKSPLFRKFDGWKDLTVASATRHVVPCEHALAFTMIDNYNLRREEIVRLMLVVRNWSTHVMRDLLRLAVRENFENCVTLILERGNLNLSDPTGRAGPTVLPRLTLDSFDLRSGYEAMSVLLNSPEVDPNAKIATTPDGPTEYLLGWAAARSNPSFLNFLLSHPRIDVNVSDGEVFRQLCKYNSAAALLFFTRADLQVHTHCFQGLKSAVSHGSSELVERIVHRLLAHDRTMNVRTYQCLLVHAAQSGPEQHTLRILLENRDLIEEPHRSAKFRDSLEHLYMGALSHTKKNHSTPLVCAAKGIFELLISYPEAAPFITIHRLADLHGNYTCILPMMILAIIRFSKEKSTKDLTKRQRKINTPDEQKSWIETNTDIYRHLYWHYLSRNDADFSSGHIDSLYRHGLIMPLQDLILAGIDNPDKPLRWNSVLTLLTQRYKCEQIAGPTDEPVQLAYRKTSCQNISLRVSAEYTGYKAEPQPYNYYKWWYVIFSAAAVNMDSLVANMLGRVCAKVVASPSDTEQSKIETIGADLQSRDTYFGVSPLVKPFIVDGALAKLDTPDCTNLWLWACTTRDPVLRKTICTHVYTLTHSYFQPDIDDTIFELTQHSDIADMEAARTWYNELIANSFV